MKSISDLKISISGIRGIVGKSFTPRLILDFTQAFSTYVGKGKIAVASDSRPTRDMVKHAVFSGLIATGNTPVDLGILPIPSFQVYVKYSRANGGIDITASHNPVEWNALKLVLKGGRFPFSFEAEEIIDIYQQGTFRKENTFPKKVYEEDAFEYHRKRLLSFADLDVIKEKKIKVVVESCNGAASPYVEEFLKKLGCDIIVINNDVNSPFPHSPEPLPENLKQLSDAVKKYGADIGFAQDADADRLAVVDEKGEPIGEEYTLALGILSYLRYKKISPIVVNLSTSRIIEDIGKEFNVKVFRSKIGEINVVEEMLTYDSFIGGEGNGGIIAKDVHLCRDSFTGMVLILELLAKTGKKVSELKSSFNQYFIKKEKIKVSLRQSLLIMEELKEKYKNEKLDFKDGIRIEAGEFWALIRPSNTEPVIRVFIEGKDKEHVESLFKEISDEIKRLRR